MRPKLPNNREELSRCTKKVVRGETRYYKTKNKYAVVNQSGNIVWFEIKDTGHYSIRNEDQ